MPLSDGENGVSLRGAPPSNWLARRRRGYQVLSYSSKSAYSMNKQQQRRE